MRERERESTLVIYCIAAYESVKLHRELSHALNIKPEPVATDTHTTYTFTVHLDVRNEENNRKRGCGEQ